MNKLRELLRSVGPALIVAAVVLGPGSILTSSKVGASFGYSAIFVVLGATVLMIGMVALAARIGAIYEKTPCEELASRLGRPVAIFIGVVLFTLVAFFQSSNNLALIAGVEPLLGDENSAVSPKAQLAILVIINAAIIAILYATSSLYKRIESLMKILIGLMVIAFLTNFVVAFLTPREAAVVASDAKPDILALLGMMGTTFSVGGAFYQAYLVKEKGWGLANVRNALFDSVVSISVLGIITAVILATSARVFYGRAEPITLGSVGDVARQLEPLFGSSATIIFCAGIIAGAFSSFLVNAMIGGTVLADALGKGGRLDDKNRWPIHLTTLALLVGMATAAATLLFGKESTVNLITLAQAMTVIGLPVLAAALIYLGTRSDLTGERKVPGWILILAVIGFLVACGLAYRLGGIVKGRLAAPEPAPAAASASAPFAAHDSTTPKA